jgi:integrase
LPRAKIPWPPEIPRRLQKTLAPFTVSSSGWSRWYRGEGRTVCGKSTPLDEVEDRWREKKALWDAEIEGDVAAARRPGGVSILDAASKYFAWLDGRVRTRMPEPMSPVTAADYKRTVNAFGESAGPGTPLGDLEQAHFTTFAKAFEGQAPTTLSRNVANLHAFLQWCEDEGLLDRVPKFGRSFVKPSQQKRRDARLDKQFSYTPEQLVLLRDNARAEELAWLGLGLCSMDNSDLAHLTFDVVDRKRKLLDYSRRKVGKIRRIIPLPEQAWKWLDAYLKVRPQPAEEAHANLVFLTPTGLPLQRVKRTDRSGKEITIDFVAMRWVRLLIRAGLREAMPDRKRKAFRGLPRRRKGEAGGDGRGFRGLRTTFANFAPATYRDEVELLMGHANGPVLLENYIGRHGLERLLEREREVVAAVWHEAFSGGARKKASGRRRGAGGGRTRRKGRRAAA